jgi:hypothetical protein
MEPKKPLKDLLAINFNPDASCFCVALTTGFRVYTTEPLAELVGCVNFINLVGNPVTIN